MLMDTLAKPSHELEVQQPVETSFLLPPPPPTPPPQGQPGQPENQTEPQESESKQQGSVSQRIQDAQNEDQQEDRKEDRKEDRRVDQKEDQQQDQDRKEGQQEDQDRKEDQQEAQPQPQDFRSAAGTWHWESDLAGARRYETHVLRWESALQLEMGRSIIDLLGRMGEAAVRKYLAATVLTAVASAVALPALLLQLTNVLAPQWTLAVERADEVFFLPLSSYST
jgi:hypothetical protein